MTEPLDLEAIEETLTQEGGAWGAWAGHHTDIESLIAEVRRLNGVYESIMGISKNIELRAEKAEAEVERLRTANENNLAALEQNIAAVGRARDRLAEAEQVAEDWRMRHADMQVDRDKLGLQLAHAERVVEAARRAAYIHTFDAEDEAVRQGLLTELASYDKGKETPDAE